MKHIYDDGIYYINHEGYCIVRLNRISAPDYITKNYKSPYMFYHRLVLSIYYGKKINKIVHHKNRNRLDNSLENLQLVDNPSEHAKLHYREVNND